MNFLADECCDALLVAGLRRGGHDVLYVVESAPGIDDETVLKMAANQDRILLTEDKVNVGYASAYLRAWDSGLIVCDLLKHNLHVSG